MKPFAIVLLSFAMGLAAPLAPNAGTDSTAASTNDGAGSSMSSSKTKSAPDAAMPGAPRSASKSTERRQGLSDNKSDCAKTGCVDSN